MPKADVDPSASFFPVASTVVWSDPVTEPLKVAPTAPEISTSASKTPALIKPPPVLLTVADA